MKKENSKAKLFENLIKLNPELKDNAFLNEGIKVALNESTAPRLEEDHLDTKEDQLDFLVKVMGMIQKKEYSEEEAELLKAGWRELPDEKINAFYSDIEDQFKKRGIDPHSLNERGIGVQGTKAILDEKIQELVDYTNQYMKNRAPEITSDNVKKFLWDNVKPEIMSVSRGVGSELGRILSVSNNVDPFVGAYEVLQANMLGDEPKSQVFLNMLKEIVPLYLEDLNSALYEGDDKWIQKAVDPAHKGDCTPMTKDTCTPARKAFAKRAKAGDLEENVETWKNDIAPSNHKHFVKQAQGLGMSPQEMYDEMKAEEDAVRPQSLNEAELSREDMMAALKSKFGLSHVDTTENFFQDPNEGVGGIWVGGENGETASDGKELFDYYSTDYGKYEFGVHNELNKFLEKNGWYAETYDPGTYMIWSSSVNENNVNEMEDYHTSSVDGAAGWAQSHAEPEYSGYAGDDPEPKDPADYFDKPEEIVTPEFKLHGSIEDPGYYLYTVWETQPNSEFGNIIAPVMDYAGKNNSQNIAHKKKYPNTTDTYANRNKEGFMGADFDDEDIPRIKQMLTKYSNVKGVPEFIQAMDKVSAEMKEYEDMLNNPGDYYQQ